ncbi:exosome complex exonuclease RRP44-like [Ylistrum balloti]|uniref:exosome complex exonuclease RRP44-like n=1 Tax=Ylistrum balloti TaxID=509963 RepID=UPI002905D32B|nr:exosome complex exonuclease RRP44-like [Ylistrum balloti]
MLTSKTFVKKTKRGRIIKIVREHYLRDDITCGSESCQTCDPFDFGQPLSSEPENKSRLCLTPHYLIPDTNVVLHQMDVLEDNVVQNVVILQTVLDEVRHRSSPGYKRLKSMLANPSKHFFTFCNEFNKHTYVERQKGESSNDRNDRAIREATNWYQKHLRAESQADLIIDVVLLTNDADNRRKAVQQGLKAFTVHEYVESLENCGHLADLLSQSQMSVHSQDRLLFPEHLPLSEIQRGIKSGRYFQGSFMASRENYLEANVSIHDKDQMVFIQGHMNLNRAVHSDVVAIEMLPEEEWSCPSSMVLEESTEKVVEDSMETEDNAVKRSKVPKELRQPTGKIVGIIKRNWRQYCGILRPSAMKEGTRHIVVPAEKRIPKIRIETRQAAELVTQRIVVAIDNWPRNSRYPQGHFVRKLGSIGDKETENEVLLLEHDVPHSNFSEAVLACLPKLPWIITDEDYKRRRDLRHIDICSVDPPGCTDIDDALHCRELENGNLEVGVHIADVSHFIRPGTAIDKEASERGTTVYLTDRRIDMVPELLSSNLCSLRSNVERFAFSILWELTHDAEIVTTSFTKSVIKSKAAFTYAEAQMKIDDTAQDDPLTRSLRHLNRLAKILKQRRIDAGALTLASPEIRFHIDSETHEPIDVQAKQIMETNSMVEEFMLLANVASAKKTLEEFPDCACLRRHPAPPPSNFDPVIKAAASKGFKIDVSKGKALADSLEAAVVPSDPYFNTMLRIMTTRCMMQAVYFCSGMIPESEYFHYGLAAGIYTHFTSPIRRFSDIIVHRLLAVCIGADASYPSLTDKHKTQVVCNNLNYRHKMAQYAGRASVNLHTHIFFKNRITNEEGYVLFVRQNALQVLIPKYGLEGTLYLSDGKSKSDPRFTYNEEASTQTCGNVTFHVFDQVIVELSIDQSNVQHLKLCLKLVKPEIPNFSVSPLSTDDSEPPTKKQKTTPSKP